MRRSVSLVVLVLLLMTSHAEAKEMTAEICGPDRCVTVSDAETVGWLHSAGLQRPAPEPAPFYVVRFHSGPNTRGPVVWSYLYVPSAKAMRGNEYGQGPVRWMSVPFLHSTITELAGGIKSHPTSASWTHASDSSGEVFPAVPVGLGSLGVVGVIAVVLLLARRSRRSRGPVGLRLEE